MLLSNKYNPKPCDAVKEKFNQIDIKCTCQTKPNQYTYTHISSGLFSHLIEIQNVFYILSYRVISYSLSCIIQYFHLMKHSNNDDHDDDDDDASPANGGGGLFFRRKLLSITHEIPNKYFY